MDMHLSRPNANLKNLNIQNYEIILKDTFKGVLNVSPKTFNCFGCESMDLKNKFCNAKHFKFQITLSERPAFTSCCRNDKAMLPAFSQN